MVVVVLHPQDFFKGPFSRNTFSPHVIYPRNPNACPNKQKKTQPNSRRRRSPPRPQAGSSPPVVPPPPPVATAAVPKGLKKKILRSSNSNNNNNSNLVVGQVRLLKRGEEIAKTVSDPDLGSTRRIGPDPLMVPTQIRLSDVRLTPASFYAGPVTLTSPPPSDVPLPAFFTKKDISMFKVNDATNDLIRILRLEI